MCALYAQNLGIPCNNFITISPVYCTVVKKLLNKTLLPVDRKYILRGGELNEISDFHSVAHTPTTSPENMLGTQFGALPLSYCIRNLGIEINLCFKKPL